MTQLLQYLSIVSHDVHSDLKIIANAVSQTPDELNSVRRRFQNESSDRLRQVV